MKYNENQLLFSLFKRVNLNTKCNTCSVRLWELMDVTYNGQNILATFLSVDFLFEWLGRNGLVKADHSKATYSNDVYLGNPCIGRQWLPSQGDLAHSCRNILAFRPQIQTQFGYISFCLIDMQIATFSWRACGQNLSGYEGSSCPDWPVLGSDGGQQPNEWLATVGQHHLLCFDNILPAGHRH